MIPSFINSWNPPPDIEPVEDRRPAAPAAIFRRLRLVRHSLTLRTLSPGPASSLFGLAVELRKAEPLLPLTPETRVDVAQYSCSDIFFFPDSHDP